MRKPYAKPAVTAIGDLATITRGSGIGAFDSFYPIDLRSPGGGGGS